MNRRSLLILAGLLGACSRPGPEVTTVATPADSTGLEAADAGLAVDPATGDALLSWVGGDTLSWSVFFARSSDRGAHWTSAVRIAGGPTEVKPHGESAPRLVAGPGGRIALIWANSVPVGGRKYPSAALRMARSDDGGKSWSTPVTLNDDTAGARVSHQFHGAGWQGDSTLVVAWLDERESAGSRPAANNEMQMEHGSGDMGAEPDAAIFLASSPDFGKSWGPNRRMWGAACPCCRISLARGNDGHLLATWRQDFPGNIRDVVVAPVADTLVTPEPIHVDGWVYPGCPHAGPAIAVGHDAAHVVWYTGKPGASGVFYARRPLGPTARASEPVALVSGTGVPTAHAAVAALTDGGAMVSWDISDGRTGIELARIDSAGRLTGQTPVAGGAGGHHPQMAALTDGSVLLAWTMLVNGRSGIRLVRVGRQ